MKRFLSLALVAALGLGLVACANEEVKEDVYDETAEEVVEEVSEEISEEEAEAEVAETEEAVEADKSI